MQRKKAQIFHKSTIRLKILDSVTVTISKFQNEIPQSLGANT